MSSYARCWRCFCRCVVSMDKNKKHSIYQLNCKLNWTLDVCDVMWCDGLFAFCRFYRDTNTKKNFLRINNSECTWMSVTHTLTQFVLWNGQFVLVLSFIVCMLFFWAELSIHSMHTHRGNKCRRHSKLFKTNTCNTHSINISYSRLQRSFNGLLPSVKWLFGFGF